MDAFLAFSSRVKAIVDKTLGTIASVMMLGLTLFALLEIVRRYLFDVVFEWGQDAVIVGMVAVISLYIGVTQIRRSHLVMNVMMHVLHRRGHLKTVAVLRIFTSGVIAVFCGAIGVTGWPTLSYAFERGLTSYSLVIPLWPFYLILMMGFLVMAFIAVLQFVEDVISLVRGDYLDAAIELTTDV